MFGRYQKELGDKFLKLAEDMNERQDRITESQEKSGQNEKGRGGGNQRGNGTGRGGGGNHGMDRCGCVNCNGYQDWLNGNYHQQGSGRGEVEAVEVKAEED